MASKTYRSTLDGVTTITTYHPGFWVRRNWQTVYYRRAWLTKAREWSDAPFKGKEKGVSHRERWEVKIDVDQQNQRKVLRKRK